MRSDDGFREFVAASSPALSRAAYLLTGDHQLAEDLLQSALASTYRHWRRVRDGNPAAYVRQAMHREQISWWRRRRLTEQLSGEPVDRMGGGDLAADAVNRITLVQALAQLPPRQRAVIVLRFYDDLTEAETARVLGCAVGTVKRQAHDALARLRTLLPAGLQPEVSA
ncbi:RNA polymerase sigma-70 factor (sigma-E family) [Hamadaea flava]|uniref:SigE family RNA polymerase sigma factor n=1 Tax=Hamadaea flava TaxID=1742688 RepID=A0ABV8M421_9ACTN|nr:SigE family RNA polymerase sigma factor [Hamadaea flava]MCP2328402.1 RNA polymerase sigma-70 factor (sigma-E family) [Hamadaea flava]